MVAKGNQFGSADDSVVINKPLIIEPALPAFTNLSDQVDITAVLHNNTEVAQKLEVEIGLDDHAIFIGKLGETIPTSIPPATRNSRSRTKQLTIDSGETEVLHFPVAMIETGEFGMEMESAIADRSPTRRFHHIKAYRRISPSDFEIVENPTG